MAASMIPPGPDIKAMRAAAEAATPGEWRVGMTASDGSAAVTVSMPFHATTITCLICEIAHREADRVHVPALSVAECDAAHIAAWCPANALAVLDRLREAEVQLEHHEYCDETIAALKERAEKAEARVAELEGRGR